MTRIALAAGLLALAGCASKLDSTHKFTLPTDGARDKVLAPDASKSAQTVKVDVTATEAVDVYVLPATAAADVADLSDKDRAAKALASKTGVTKDAVTAKVAANQEYRVVVTLPPASKKADVTVRLTN